MNKVRMADIAQALDISVVSVSKGLSGKDGVSDELRARILETAEMMGYKTQESSNTEIKSIGAVVADRFFQENVLYYTLYGNLLNECQRRGISMMLEIIPRERERACEVPALIASQKPDGLILIGEFSADYCRMMLSQGVPVVYLDFHKSDVPCETVISDGLNGGCEITEHLITGGRTKLAYVGSINATSSIMDRYLGFTRALLRAGIFPRRDWLLEDRDENGVLIPVKLPDEMPEAFVCNCDTVAIDLIANLNSRGYRVPEDVAVVGYDDFKFSAMCHPPLTTYRVDIEKMAQAAIALLRRKVLKKRNMSPSVVIPGCLVVRKSAEVKE